MEGHFLEGYVNGEQSFSDAPWYNPDGDCIICLLADEATVAERVDEILTVYRSAVDNRPIGFQIKGVQALIKMFGLDGLTFHADRTQKELTGVAVSVLLLAAYERGPHSMSRRMGYVTALESYPKGATISASDFAVN